MSIDLLRADANERVDLLDFQYLANTTFEEAIRVQANWFLTDYNKSRQWVLDGFAMANPSGKQLQVTIGRAILARRVSGTVRYGIVTGAGDLTKIVDMTALTPGTYNVYIRFEFVDGDNSSRIFWNPAGSGSEIVQTMATRLQANWSMRVETGSPGAEWLQIGTANNVSGSLVIVDQRPLYFEGLPSATYASGWSTDGGGSSNDRNVDRQAYGAKDLQTFTAALRQCLEDIKGRGLRRWWDRDIGGMNIGFDADPVAGHLAIGDANYYLYNNTLEPALYVDSGGSRLTFDRANLHWRHWVSGTEEMRLGADGLVIANGLYVGDVVGTPVDNEIYAEGQIRSNTNLWTTNGTIYTGLNTNSYFYNTATGGNLYCNSAAILLWTAAGLVNVAGGLRVGDGGTATDNDIYAVGDIISGNYLYAANYRLYLGPVGSDDYMVWDGTHWSTYLNAVEELRLGTDGLVVANGLHVGDLAVAPTDDAVTVTDANFGLFGSATVPQLKFGAADYMHVTRATHQWDLYLNSVNTVSADSAGVFPGANDSKTLGTLSRRWSVMHASEINMGDGAGVLVNQNTELMQAKPIVVHAINVSGVAVLVGEAVSYDGLTYADNIFRINNPGGNADWRAFGVAMENINSMAVGQIAVWGICQVKSSTLGFAGSRLGTWLGGGLGNGNTVDWPPANFTFCTQISGKIGNYVWCFVNSLMY